MNKVICHKNKDYTTISNVFLRDENLSLKAKGLLAIVMSLPNDWDFSISGITRIIKEGKTAVYSTITELKENGYCQVITTRNEKGVITGNDYEFFETPNNAAPYTENPHTENPNMDNQPQINKDNNKIKTKTNKEEIKEYKEKFAAFVSLYKKLTNKRTRSVDTEFNDFIKRHANWRQIIPYLSIAIQRETKERNEARTAHKFFPEPKMLQTYLGKQKAWEAYVNVDDDLSAVTNEYTPATDGAIKWNETRQCYIYLNMFFGYIPDGYSDDNRPDGATIMINNSCQILTWNKNEKKWMEKGNL